MKKICVVGCGYVGQRFASSRLQRGDALRIVSRSIPGFLGTQPLQSAAVKTDFVQMHWCDREFSGESIDCDVLLFSVSHRVPSLSDADRYGNDHPTGLQNVVDRLRKPPQVLVYLSTTGVFETQFDGQWVEESSSKSPARPGAQNAWAGEQWVGQNAAKMPKTSSFVLRPAGIYGPDRIPNLESLRKQIPIAAVADSYLNLIHVDDLVGVINKVVDSASAGGLETYNVSDGEPVDRLTYYRYLSELIDAPAPRFVEQKTNETAVGANSVDRTSSSSIKIRSRGEGSKRISNRRLIEQIGYKFIYPSFREGLRSAIGM